MKGGILEQTGELERHTVSSRDVNFRLHQDLQRTVCYIMDLQKSLREDTAVSTSYPLFAESLSRSFHGMITYLTVELPKVFAANGNPFLRDHTLWLKQDSVAVIGALRKFQYTCFNTTTTFRASKALREKSLRWWKADIAGDGVHPVRFSNRFTHKECVEFITPETRFCTTGTSGMVSISKRVSNNGVLCHYYPIATHTSDMRSEYEEALISLVRSLHKNKALADFRYNLSRKYYACNCFISFKYF